jgi:hypothetical protein
MPRYRLRTLLILLAVGPPMLGYIYGAESLHGWLFFYLACVVLFYLSPLLIGCVVCFISDTTTRQD